MRQTTSNGSRPRRTPPPPPQPKVIVAETEPRFSETMWFKLGGADDSATAALLARPATDEAELEERYVDSGLLTIEDERAYSLNAPRPSRGLTNDETEFLDRYTDDDIARYMVTERVPGRRRIGLVVGIAVLAVSFAAAALPAGVVHSVAEVARAEATVPAAAPAVEDEQPERVAVKQPAPAPAPEPVAAAPAPAPVEVTLKLEARSQTRSVKTERVAAKRGKARRVTKRERARRARAERARKAKAAKLAKAKRAKARKARLAKAKRAKARKAKRAKARKAKRAKAKRARDKRKQRDRRRRG